MTIEQVPKRDAVLVHQDNIGEDEAPEAPLLIVPYVGTIEITQGGLRPAIQIQPGTVPELCRVLRKMAKGEGGDS